jgi:lipopolysaccharide/colanic/teichoic acid biosynthesis glycosyltransferase
LGKLTVSKSKQQEEYLASCIEGSTTVNISIDIIRKPSLLYYISKRLVDIILATLGLVVLMPIFLAVAICIKLDDAGEVLYRREMIGLRGRRFIILKFRTMIPNADAYLEQYPELMLEYQKNMKLKHDPRVTRVGSFLRKTALDELPQLLNVLVGHMSLVGPRSLPASELMRYGEYAKKRLTVKPGITGLWQISERRHISYDERIPLDMQYIDNRSIFLDLVILVKTPMVVIVHAK